MVLLRTTLVFGITLCAMFIFIPIGLFAFFFGFLGLRKPMSWIAYKLVQTWAKLIVFITGCTPEVKGAELIPRQGGVCFVSNHVGVFDIVLTFAYVGRPFGFVAKKELLFFPFVNMWVFMLGGLFIDRKNIRKAMKAIELGNRKLRNGGGMLIFPEGTRSKDRGLLPFRPGALKLATSSLVPIIPMAVSGSYEVFEKNYLVHAAPVRIVFCPPIITAEMNPEERRHKLPEQVRAAIEAALVKPEPETIST